jgi:transposase-like protein
MSQKRKTKEEIVAEYLTGNYTYRELGLKYDIPYRSICDWVLEYQGVIGNYNCTNFGK